jgi:hypothetical protein
MRERKIGVRLRSRSERLVQKTFGRRWVRNFHPKHLPRRRLADQIHPCPVPVIVQMPALDGVRG